MTDAVFEKFEAKDIQVDILYKLLLAREHTISHRSIPDLKNHVDFVKNHPYRAWYIVKRNGDVLGSFYLHPNNFLGINLLQPELGLVRDIVNFVVEQFRPLPEIKSTKPEYFHINVSSEDKLMLSLLKQLGLAEIQVTHKIAGKIKHD